MIRIMAVTTEALGVLLASLSDPAELDDSSSLTCRITPGEVRRGPGEWEYELVAGRYPSITASYSWPRSGYPPAICPRWSRACAEIANHGRIPKWSAETQRPGRSVVPGIRGTAGMSAAASAILDGMPSPRDLRRLDTGGETVIFAGPVQLFRFAGDDAAMRHIAAAGLRQLGFAGKDVAAVLGLTPSYVATLRQRALREGTAALVRPAGRPRETGEEAWERARAWRARGARDAEIARRLGVNQSTVLRRLGRAHVQDPLSHDGPEPRPEPDTEESRSSRHRNRGSSRSPRSRRRWRSLRYPCRPGSCRGTAGRPRGRYGRGTRGRCCCTRSPKPPRAGLRAFRFWVCSAQNHNHGRGASFQWVAG